MLCDMTDVLHTPGPWHAPLVRDERVGHLKDVHIVTGDPKRHIALIYGRETEEEEVANARLIAAAPALLDVVRALTEDVVEDAVTGPVRACCGVAYDYALVRGVFPRNPHAPDCAAIAALLLATGGTR